MTLVDRILFFPDSHDHGHSPRDDDCVYRDIEIPSGDSTLHGWYAETGNATPLGTVVQFHGNAANITNHWPLASWALVAGYDVLSFDYRGFGRSPGTATLQNAYADSVAVMQFADKSPLIRDRSLVLLGQSIGGYLVQCALNGDAPTNHIAAIILDSTFRDLHSLAKTKAKEVLPFGLATYVPISLLLGTIPTPPDDLESHCPVVVLHSIFDNVVPFREGETLFQRLSPPKELISFALKGHLSFFSTRPQNEWQRFNRWLGNATNAANNCVNRSGGSRRI